MTIELDEFRRYLSIDKHNLDEELSQQASLLFKVGEACVEAAAERDSLKEELAMVDASLDQEVREANECLKTTEASIKSQILTDKRHKQAYDAFAASKLLADQLTALKESFHQRGYMLRDLTSLHVANYYQTESVRGTNATDLHVYHKQRERLAVGRTERKRP